jgi:hypothetical protein
MWVQFDLVGPASITAMVAIARTELRGLDGVANVAAARKS